MQKIRPFLWYNTNAEEAIDYYVTVFKNSKILSKSYYGEGTPMPSGTLMSATFEIEGQEFVAFNGGPHYTFTPAISLFVDCQSQEEVDELWDKLSTGGPNERCGWLVDKFGLSWQIIPSVLGQLLNDPDPIKAQRVMEAMFEMNKIDIKGLQDAYNNL